MKVFKLMFLLVILLANTGYAQGNIKESKLKELMKLQGLYEMIEQQQKYCQEQAKAIGPRMLEQLKKQMPGNDKAVIDELEKAYLKFIASAKPTWTVQEAVDAWAKYYGDQVTDNELDKILEFYRSPIGQKDVAASKSALPKWTAHFTTKNQQVLENATNAYIEDLKGIIERFKTKKDKQQ